MTEVEDYISRVKAKLEETFPGVVFKVSIDSLLPSEELLPGQTLYFEWDELNHNISRDDICKALATVDIPNQFALLVPSLRKYITTG